MHARVARNSRRRPMPAFALRTAAPLTRRDDKASGIRQKPLFWGEKAIRADVVLAEYNARCCGIPGWRGEGAVRRKCHC